MRRWRGCDGIQQIGSYIVVLSEVCEGAETVLASLVEDDAQTAFVLPADGSIITNLAFQEGGGPPTETTTQPPPSRPSALSPAPSA